MVQLAAKVAKVSLNVPFGSNWATRVEEAKTARSRSTTGIGANTAGCKSASRWACAATVRTILRICTKVCGVLSFCFPSLRHPNL